MVQLQFPTLHKAIVGHGGEGWLGESPDVSYDLKDNLYDLFMLICCNVTVYIVGDLRSILVLFFT